METNFGGIAIPELDKITHVIFYSAPEFVPPEEWDDIYTDFYPDKIFCREENQDFYFDSALGRIPEYEGAERKTS